MLRKNLRTQRTKKSRKMRNKYKTQAEKIASEVNKLVVHDSFLNIDVDAEKMILGSLISRADVNHEVFKMVPNELYFNEKKHQIIYKSIMGLYQSAKEIDYITILDTLTTNQQKAIGGPTYLSELVNMVGVVNESNIGYWCEILLKNSTKIHLRSVIVDALKGLLNNNDVNSTLSKLSKEIDDLSNLSKSSEPELIKDLMYPFLKEVEEAHKLRLEAEEKGEYCVSGVPTGLTMLDLFTSGWQSGDLILLAGRPGMGKSALAFHLAKMAANSNYPVAIANYEMNSMSILARLMSSITEVQGNAILKSGTNEDEFQKINSAAAELEGLPIYLNNENLVLFQLCAKIRYWVIVQGVRLVIIDYIQLIKTGNKSPIREVEVSEISRTLKLLAQELDVPIIALSQLSRAVETRGGEKRPLLSDLRESGSLEQDADIVMFVYRPEYYGIEADADGISTENLTEVIFAKNRSGDVGTVELTSNLSYSRYSDRNSEYDTQVSSF